MGNKLSKLDKFLQSQDIYGEGYEDPRDRALNDYFGSPNHFDNLKKQARSWDKKRSEPAKRDLKQEFNYDYKKPWYQFWNEGGRIEIDPKNKGKFTAKAKAKGKGVQEYASQVMANKENYSPATVKQANFARNQTHPTPVSYTHLTLPTIYSV